MENAAPIIQCQNLNCLSSNPLTNKFCEKCGTPLVKRYLWVLGDWVRNYYPIGELILERYQVIEPQIVLDTKPALPPQAPDEFPESILPYLKLFPQRLHIPQIYDYVPPPDDRINNMDIWFLEYGTLPTRENGQLQYPNLLPQLRELWSGANPLRQLNWLWQIANLWTPLKNQGVVPSLLNPDLIRVNNRIIQLLQLQLDTAPSPSLQDLGQLWSEWLPQTAPELLSFLEPLAEKLSQGEIKQPAALLSLLDNALYHYGKTKERTYYIYTCTDAGTMREHNEDACYPAANQSLILQEPTDSLVIVCDGIGGQDGGEIASQLAIETLQAQILGESSPRIENNPDAQSRRLLEAIRTTNDLISDRNDQEHRQERQRMGTTVVIALAHDHEVYIGHVGDSRGYWITPTSCHQITVDDDLASREVRLGYLVYRDAIQYPNSGALVQAVGTSNGASIHPTVQRFIVDEDCVFILCSDGLSDNDRVEQYWENEIVPILAGQKSVSEVGQALLQIANEKNGHDNSTIALLYCQVQPQGSPQPIPSFEEMQPLVSSLNTIPTTSDPKNEIEFFHEFPENDLPTEASLAAPLPPPVQSTTAQPNPLPVLLGTLMATALAVVGLGWYLWKQLHPSISPVVVSTTVTVSPLKPGIYKLTAPIQLKSTPDLDSLYYEYPAGTVVKLSGDPTKRNFVPVEVCLDGSLISTWLERSQLKTFLASTNAAKDIAQCSPPPTPKNSP